MFDTVHFYRLPRACKNTEAKNSILQKIVFLLIAMTFYQLLYLLPIPKAFIHQIRPLRVAFCHLQCLTE